MFKSLLSVGTRDGSEKEVTRMFNFSLCLVFAHL